VIIRDGAATWKTIHVRVMAVLRQEHFAQGKASVFDTLQAFVGIGESRSEATPTANP
jgi:hypothetical protein